MNNILFTATLTYKVRSTKFDSLYVIAAPNEEAAKTLIDDLEGWNITNDVDCGYVLEMKEIGTTNLDIGIIEEITT
jgi:hypothetical protein